MYDPAPRFGRLVAPDPRDQSHLLRQINPAAAVEAANVPYKYWRHSTVIDQGDSSACTGASARQWLNMGPVVNKSGPDYMKIYHSAQLLDEWPGAEPAYYGSSVRAAFKVLKGLGFVKSYAWAFDLDTVVNHVLTAGPCVIGSSWYQGQMRTDKDGFVHVDGRQVGGHAWTLAGVNRERKCPDGSVGCGRILNSWGKGFGQNGLAWISFKDLEALILDQGECATSLEIKPAAVAAV